MSKASQRALADRQRRQREQGLADPRAIERILLDPLLTQNPVKLWSALDKSVKAAKPHPDDPGLRAFQQSCRPMLSALAISQVSFDDESLPFPSFLVHADGKHTVYTAMSLEGRPESEVSDLFGLMDRRLQGLDGCDHLLLCLSAPVVLHHLVCLGISRGGARLVWAFLDEQWYATRHTEKFARIFSRGLDLMDETEETQAFATLLDFVRNNAPAMIESEAQFDAFQAVVRSAFDLAQQPFFDMSLNAAEAHSEALEYADFVEADAAERTKEIDMRRQDAQRRLHAIEARARSADSAAPGSSAPAASAPTAAPAPRPPAHASLEERLSAFF